MRIRQVVSFALATFLAVAGAGLQNPAHAGSLIYEILADTSGIGTGGLIDMNINAVNFPTLPSVSVLVYNPITDGTVTPGFSGIDPPIGTASGDLTGPGVSMNNTVFSEGGQDFAAKSFFDVFVDISGSEVGPGAVGPWSGSVFTFSISDAAGNSVGATFTVNPNVDTNGNPIVDGTIYPQPTADVRVIPVSGSAIPEPSSVILLGLGLEAVVVAGRLRTRRAG